MKKKYMSVLLSVCLTVMSLTAVCRAEEQTETVDAAAVTAAEETAAGTEQAAWADEMTELNTVEQLDETSGIKTAGDETPSGVEEDGAAELQPDGNVPDTQIAEEPVQEELTDEVTEADEFVIFGEVEAGTETEFEEGLPVEGADTGISEETVEGAVEEWAASEEIMEQPPAVEDNFETEAAEEEIFIVEADAGAEESFAQTELIPDTEDALFEEAGSSEDEEERAEEAEAVPEEIVPEEYEVQMPETGLPEVSAEEAGVRAALLPERAGGDRRLEYRALLHGRDAGRDADDDPRPW